MIAYQVKKDSYNEKLREYEEKGGNRPKAPHVPKQPKRPRMQPEEVSNFMLLVKALTLLLAPSLTLEDLERGDTMLREFLLGFKKVRQ